MTVPMAPAGAGRGVAHGRDPALVRRRPDLVWLAVGAVLLVLSALPVDEDSLSGAERSMFRAVNEVPGVPFAVIWLVMQAGNVAAVALSALAALVTRRARLAVSFLAAGAVAYGGAKLVKELVVRGRPPTLLDGVEIHGDEAQGMGFVSGHAAVVVALAVVAFPYLGRRSRWLVAGCAFAVCLARVYVGAHLPLDVVGGAALGLLVGAGVRLVAGRPVSCS